MLVLVSFEHGIIRYNTDILIRDSLNKFKYIYINELETGVAP